MVIPGVVRQGQPTRDQFSLRSARRSATIPGINPAVM
jgi:hypothetical protein